VGRRRARRPKVSIVRTSGQAKTKLVTPKPTEKKPKGQGINLAALAREEMWAYLMVRVDPRIGTGCVNFQRETTLSEDVVGRRGTMV
jgi:hypothetical protein